MAPSPPRLSGAALRKLRSLGHALSPVVAIGKDGLTDALVAAADAAIGTHELVKIKIQREAPVDRHEAGIEIAARTGSVLAQVVGRTLLLYRRHPKKPKIELPAPGKAPKRVIATAAKSKVPAKSTAAASSGRGVADHEDEEDQDEEGGGEGESVEIDGDDEGDLEENP